MVALTLAEVSAAVGGVLVRGVLIGASDDEADAATSARRIETRSAQTDSRLVVPGSMFFALHGEATDGHLFAPAAAQNGAAVVIVERELDLPVAQIVVPDTLEALADLARHVVASVRATGDLTVIGVTGSNGKTTTKNMLRAVLEAEGPTVAPKGSFNNQVGAPLTMLLVEQDTRFLVIEMGASAEGDIARTMAIATPDISIVLKVGLAHAGEFGGIEVTQRAKSEIVTTLPETAIAVLNHDDERVAAMAGVTKARVAWFGLEPRQVTDGSAIVWADDLRATARGTEFTLEAGDIHLPGRLKILGEHHVMNALATLTVAKELGLDLAAALERLSAIPRAERWRMELIERPDGVIVINDAYNASPDSMAAALKTLAQIAEPGQRTVAVLGEMNALGELAQDEHDRIGRLIVRLNIHKLVVIGHGARHIHNAAGLEGSWDGESVLVDTVDEAYDLLRDELRAGDVVLVKSSNAMGLRYLGDRLAVPPTPEGTAA